MARGRVSPDWWILGHVLTPVAGSRDRVRGSEPSLNHIHRLYLRKNTVARRNGKRKGVGQRKNTHYRVFPKARNSRDFWSLLLYPWLSQPCACAVETLPQVIAGPLVSSPEISSENRLRESHRVFQPMILFCPLASMRWEEWDSDDYTPRKTNWKSLSDNKITFLSSWLYLYHLNWYTGM